MSQLKITTFNIRCVYRGDGVNAFIHRAGLIWDTVQTEKPDVIGFQEVTPSILNLLKVLLNDYEVIGHGREDNFDGEGLYVAVRKDTCSILSCDTYWLGENIYKYSRIQGQYCPRIFNTVKIKHLESGKLFRVYNAHLDCTPDENVRAKEMNILLARATEEYNIHALPFVVMGDFNSYPHEAPITACNSFEAVPLTDLTAHITHTYHEYGKYTENFKIDYIFATKEFADAVVETRAWDVCNNGIYLSDHYPISSTFEI